LVQKPKAFVFYNRTLRFLIFYRKERKGNAKERKVDFFAYFAVNLCALCG